MSDNPVHGPERSPLAVAEKSMGLPGEGRFLAGFGKALMQLIDRLEDQMAAATVRAEKAQAAMARAGRVAEERKAQHRGGDRPWPLRLLIPLAVVAEAVTAFVAMQVLVSSLTLAVGLAALAALAGAGLACILANHRLNRLPVPRAARILEGIFVLVLTVLRYDSLHVQGADWLAAAGGAVLAALISALGLLGIEELAVETHTFSVFASKLRVSCNGWRCDRATARLSRIKAELEAAAETLGRNFLDFLLTVEGVSVDEAQRRADELKHALTD